MKLHKTKDLYAGALFVLFGLGAMSVARTYPIGTAGRMGPAYFPMIVGGILAFLGLIIVLRAMRAGGAALEPFALRPLVMLLGAVTAFGLLIQPIGLVGTLLVLLVLGCLADSQFRLADLAILYVVLVILATGVFVYVLGLPLKVWPV